MERFLVFGGEKYYAMGGLFDFKMSSRLLSDAVSIARSSGWEWWHVWDSVSGLVLSQGSENAFGARSNSVIKVEDNEWV